MKTNTFFDRMSPKSLNGLMASHFQRQYRLSPQAAETICRDAVLVRSIFGQPSRADGQIIYYAVKLGESAGKRIRDCQLVSVKLTLRDPGDLAYRKKHGQKGLVHHVVQRVCREAYEQGAVLSIEDVASVLFLSESTVKRYKRALERAGTPLILRGDTADMGPGTCHRDRIVELFLQGYSETEVAQRMNHALENVECYLRDFIRVCLLLAGNYKPGIVARITHLSKSKVLAIEAAYQRLSQDSFYQEPLSKVLEMYELRRSLKKGAVEA